VQRIIQLRTEKRRAEGGLGGTVLPYWSCSWAHRNSRRGSPLFTLSFCSASGFAGTALPLLSWLGGCDRTQDLGAAGTGRIRRSAMSVLWNADDPLR
jgi:hypothetical protein